MPRPAMVNAPETPVRAWPWRRKAGRWDRRQRPKRSVREPYGETGIATGRSVWHRPARTRWSSGAEDWRQGLAFKVAQAARALADTARGNLG